MNFFKTVLASALGLLVLIILVFIIGIGIAANIATSDIVMVDDNSILELNFEANLKDYVSEEQNVLGSVLSVNKEIGFNKILQTIKIAKNDSKIKAISINKIPPNIGWAQLTELRKELQNFKKANKKVWAYADQYSQKRYYLATVADTLVVSPIGSIELTGLHTETMFFKDFQEKYGIQMEVIRHGKYKSAVEPFIANKMSPENRQQISELILSIWQQVKTDIENSRDLDTESAVLNLHGRLPLIAAENNLVDALWYKDDYEKNFIKAVNENAKVVKMKDYLQHNFANLTIDVASSNIAVIYAQGEIIYGKGDQNKIGQGIMLKAFDNALEDDTIKAIVLRIDSPGGSALTSDLIWNTIEKAKKIKPIVVSMGNHAASGGYYIACNAHKIYAEPTTITGSIGVFGTIPNAHKIAKENGINSETVSTHNNGAHYSVVQPLNSKKRASIQEGIEFIYSTFINRVAQGRNMTIASVDSIAQGRVWTGAQAQKIGLVDELGNIDDAIKHAASLAQINDYETIELPYHEMDIEQLIQGSFFTQVLGKSDTPFSVKNKVYTKLQEVESVLKMEGIQARMPFKLDVE